MFTENGWTNQVFLWFLRVSRKPEPRFSASRNRKNVSFCRELVALSSYVVKTNHFNDFCVLKNLGFGFLAFWRNPSELEMCGTGSGPGPGPGSRSQKIKLDRDCSRDRDQIFKFNRVHGQERDSNLKWCDILNFVVF